MNSLSTKGNIVQLTTAYSGTSFTTATIPTGFRYYFLSVRVSGTSRVLGTAMITKEEAKACTNSSSVSGVTYGADPSNYSASIYFSSDLTKAYIKSASQYDSAILYGVR